MQESIKKSEVRSLFEAFVVATTIAKRFFNRLTRFWRLGTRMSSAVRSAHHRVALWGLLTTPIGVAIIGLPRRITMFVVHLDLARWTSSMKVRFTKTNTTFLRALAIVLSVTTATVLVVLRTDFTPRWACTLKMIITRLHTTKFLVVSRRC